MQVWCVIERVRKRKCVREKFLGVCVREGEREDSVCMRETFLSPSNTAALSSSLICRYGVCVRERKKERVRERARESE